MNYVNIKCTVGECLRPFIRCLPFGRVRALGLFGARLQEDVSWNNLTFPVRVFFDRQLSAYMAVNLRDWGGRWYYFTGKYFDQMNQLLIHKLLGEGDTYIDIGANVGVHTITASRVVGERGFVIAIEPHPTTFSYLKAHLVINRITNVSSRNVGLSDSAGELELSSANERSGAFSFRSVAQRRHIVKVPVVVGDQIIDKSLLRNRVLVKVDTEGFEHHVLRGLKELMCYKEIGFVIEVTDLWLRETGSSAAELYAELKEQGFQAYNLRLVYSWLRPVLALEPSSVPPLNQRDILFVRAGFLK